MRWRDMRRSRNVEDVRGSRRGGGGRTAGVGIGGLVIALLASWLFGVNPVDVLVGLQGGEVAPPAQVEVAPINDRDADFVKAVLSDTEGAQGYVVPESFTHGSSQQRVNWFVRGLKERNVNRCNTFERNAL